MIRFILRLASIAVLGAAVALVVLDAAASIAADAVVWTPLSRRWEEWSPGSFADLRSHVVGWLGEAVWAGPAQALLDLPGFAVLAGLALVLGILGHVPEGTEPRPRDGAPDWPEGGPHPI